MTIRRYEVCAGLAAEMIAGGGERYKESGNKRRALQARIEQIKDRPRLGHLHQDIHFLNPRVEFIQQEFIVDLGVDTVMQYQRRLADTACRHERR